MAAGLIVVTAWAGRYGARGASIPDGTGNHWAPVAARAEGNDNGIRALAPINGHDVWAVGRTIDHWNGTKWSVVDQGIIGQTSNSPLNGLNAAAVVPNSSPTQVWGVGSSWSSDGRSSTGRIERFGGSHWRIVPSPNPGTLGNLLFGVGASGPRDAWAVGFQVSNTSYSQLILHWDGAKWTVVNTSSLPAFSILSSISVAGPKRAWAVGQYPSAGKWHPLAERWDGQTWTQVAIPDPGGSDVLRSITPDGHGGLWAVGETSSGNTSSTLIERYNGSMWSILPSPSAGGSHSSLESVTAPEGDAWAVGETFAPSANTLIEHWTGSAWKIVPSPNRATTSNTFSAVSPIPGAGQIWAAGGLVARLVQGRWTVLPAPNIGVDHHLTGVATVAGNHMLRAWAVGQIQPRYSPSIATVDRWTGARWAPMTVPQPGPANGLAGVTALAPNDAWAVGTRYSIVNRTLTEHWNGKTWAVVNSPSLGPGDSGLFAVTGIGPNDVWASGQANNDQPLLEHWNGRRWSMVSSAPFTDPVSLNGISGRPGTDVWAVGTDQSEFGDLPVAERWDGSTWKVIPIKNPTFPFGELETVSVLSNSDVWAGGYYLDNASVRRPLIEHWNGQTWNYVPSPDPGSVDTEILSLQAHSATDVLAAGKAWGPKDRPPIIERWNGSRWSVDHSPAFRGVSGEFGAIAVDERHRLGLAVGDQPNRLGILQPMSFRWPSP